MAENEKYIYIRYIFLHWIIDMHICLGDSIK